MIIPVEVLKDLGIEKLQEEPKEELDMFAPMPYPMRSVNNAWWDLDMMRSKFEFYKSIYENASSHKCTEEEIYSMEAYDNDSLKFGQFLVDNMSRVCVWDGSEHKEAFIALFTYSCREHVLEFNVSGSRDEVMKLLYENIEHSNLYNVIRYDKSAAIMFDAIDKEDGDSIVSCMEAVVQILKNHGKWDKYEVMLHVLSNCRFIPLVIVDPIVGVISGTNSFTYSDIKTRPDVMNLISDFLGMADIKPNRNKFYFVRRSPKFGWYLKKDEAKKAVGTVTNLNVPTESVPWGDIKADFGIRCGLNNYLAEVDYLPADEICYFVKVNESTNELWLKRDMEKSPKSVKTGKNKNKKKK